MILRLKKSVATSLLLLACCLASGPAMLRAEADHGKADPAHKHEGEAAGHGQHADEAVPGLVPSVDLATWQLITFLIFLGVLGKYAWGPLQSGLEKREAKIRQDISDAEAQRLKAEQLLKDYESRLAKTQDEVREILAEARRDADRTKQEIVAAAQQEAETTRRRAIEDIQRSKDHALSELFDFVSSNAMAAAEQVVQRSLKSEDHERLIREALDQLNVRRN
jgi:F-type H+-transporting ATPase subunit b